MTPDPKRRGSNDSEDLDSEEMVNDSLGEGTPSDATGLDDADEQEAEPGSRKRPA